MVPFPDAATGGTMLGSADPRRSTGRSMARCAGAMLVLAAWPLAAMAGELEQASPAQPAATPPPVEGPAPAAPSTTAAAPAVPWWTRVDLRAGWGYYEAFHAGVAYRVTERAALELFGGGGAQGYTTRGSLGVAFSHAIGRPRWMVQPGWDLKTIFWTQDDPNYDWKFLSVVLGGYLVGELDPRVAVKLDAGVALSGALESDRKQNENFGHPRRWNGTVCLELVYRLGGS